MTLNDFISKYDNQGIDFDGYYGFQCMDAAQQYVTECLTNPALSGPNAIDCWTTYQKDLYQAITNTPDGVPQAGDILIWGQGVGQYGHIAVFISGDSNQFTSFDQNWPIGSVCHKQQHNYTNLLGWLHPQISNMMQVDKTTFANLVTKSTLADSFVAAGFNTAQDAQNTIQKYLDDKNTAEHNVEVLTGQYNASQAVVESLTSQNLALQQQIKDLQNTPVNPAPANPAPITPLHPTLAKFLGLLLGENLTICESQG